jgi:hypothetical protein
MALGHGKHVNARESVGGASPPVTSENKFPSPRRDCLAATRLPTGASTAILQAVRNPRTRLTVFYSLQRFAIRHTERSKDTSEATDEANLLGPSRLLQEGSPEEHFPTHENVPER